MLVQIGFKSQTQTNGKPNLVWRMIALDQITDISPDESGKAIVSRAASNIPGVKSQWSTWETIDAVSDRIANANPLAAGVLASQDDRASAQTAHDANP